MQEKEGERVGGAADVFYVFPLIPNPGLEGNPSRTRSIIVPITLTE